MDMKNSRDDGSEVNQEPRFLNPLTIKDIEDMAYRENESIEPDVKIWIPKSMKRQYL